MTLKICKCVEPVYAWNASKQRHTCVVCGGLAPVNVTMIAVTHVIPPRADECTGCHGDGCSQCAYSGLQK